MNKFLSVLLILCAATSVNAQPNSNAPALDRAKKQCTDLGFKAGTERFGSCVLQLSRNDQPSDDASKPTQSKEQAVALPPAPKSFRTFKDCVNCPEMVMLPAGSFLMGTKNDPFKSGVDAFETPQHSVRVQSFAIGRTEVTQEQWYALMGTLPSKLEGRTLPVTQVSYGDAKDFLKKLSEKTGKNYRLPNEAEWEYACRAGTGKEYCGGDNVERVGWLNTNSGNRTQNVAGKEANGWGIYDMSGNVWELTEDCWNESYNGAPNNGIAWSTGDCTERIVRGGSFVSGLQGTRSADRSSFPFSFRSEFIGFRVARTR